MTVVIGIGAALGSGLAGGTQIKVHLLERPLFERACIWFVFLAAEMCHPRRDRAVAGNPKSLDAGHIDIGHLDRLQHARCWILVQHGEVHGHGERRVKVDRRLFGIDVRRLGPVFKMIDHKDGVTLDSVYCRIGDNQHREAVGASRKERTARDITFAVRGRLQDGLPVLVDDKAVIPAPHVVAGTLQCLEREGIRLLAAVWQSDHRLRARVGIGHLHRIGRRWRRGELNRFHLDRLGAICMSRNGHERSEDQDRHEQDVQSHETSFRPLTTQCVSVLTTKTQPARATQL